ncbi:MAG: WXG100 family type VII secretion target [Janibacter sp.]
MTVSHGMDLARVRQISGQLRAEARRAGEIADQGSACVATLEGAWEGADLESFSASWMSARPTLEAASTRLSAFADQLLEQADSQETASEAGSGAGGGGVGGGAGSGSGGGSGGSGGGPWDTVSDVIDGLGFWSGRLGDLAGIATGIGMWKFGQFNPRGRLPSGRYGFLGHKPGSPFSKLPWHQRAGYFAKDSSWIAKGGPNAAKNVAGFAKWSKVARVSGPVGAGLSGVFGGVNQWAEDMGDPSIGTGERATRAVSNGVATGGTTFGMALAGAKGGAVVGGLIGGPVGAAVGGVAGGIIGGVAGSKVGESIGSAAADGSSWVGDKLGLW